MVSIRVVDVQGFTYNHTFILRELAYYDLCEVKGVLFDKPFAWNNLNHSDRRTNRHLTYRFHVLRWNAKGDVPYEMIKTTLRSALIDNRLIV